MEGGYVLEQEFFGTYWLIHKTTEREEEGALALIFGCKYDNPWG